MGGAQLLAGVHPAALAAQPLAVQQVRAGQVTTTRVRPRRSIASAVERSAASPSLSSARERASMPSAQSVPAARCLVRRAARPRRAPACPLRAAASTSSVITQVDNPRSVLAARSAAASVLVPAEAVEEHRGSLFGGDQAQPLAAVDHVLPVVWIRGGASASGRARRPAGQATCGSAGYRSPR